MNLEELIKSGLVKDNHIIKIIRPPVYIKNNKLISNDGDLLERPFWSAKFYANSGTWVVTLEDMYVHENENAVQPF